jgi:PAS domain S-box-containing protein
MVRIGLHAGLGEGQDTVVEAGAPASPEHDTRRDMRIPLRIEDHLTGFLHLVGATQLDDDDADDLAGIAEAVAQYVERRRAQEALDRNTLRFRTLIERSADMLTLQPRDGTVTFVSAATSRLLGYTPADMVHRPLVELVHRQDRKRLQRAYLGLVSQPGEVATGRYRMRHADGSWRWIEVTGRNLLDLEIPWWFRDVTAEVEAQEVLERRVDERTRELRSLLEASASLSSTLDLHAVLARMLDQMRQVVEYSAAGVVVTDGSELVTLEYRGELPREDMLRIRLPRDSVVGRGVEVVGRTHAPLTVDDLGVDGPGYAQVAAKGVTIPSKAVARGRAALYVPMIAHGDVIGVVAMAHPVPGFYTSAHAELALAFAQQAAIAVENARLFEKTEQLAVLESQERRAAEARYRGLFVGAVDALLVTAPGGEILDANPAATSLLGWSADELLGADGPALMSTDSSIKADYGSLRTEGHWEGEMDLRRNDGRRVPLEVRTTRIDLPSGPIYVAALRDITERRRAAELLEQRVTERTRELSSLLEVARSMGSTLELRSLVEVISAEVKNIVDYTALGVFVRLEDGRYQFFDYAGPLPRERVVGAISGDVYEPIWRELESTQQPIIRNEPHEDPPIEWQLPEDSAQLPLRDESPIRSQLVVPWVVQDEVKGAFVLSHSRRHYYTDHHARLTVAFAQHAAVALENARLYAAARDTAALEERQKLARELHDSVSQALYAIALNSAAAQSRLKDETPVRTARLLREVRRLSRAGMAEMRALIFELRPESLTEEGLLGALTKQAAAVQARYGLRVRLAMTREPDVSVQRKEALYRIAQEALQNAVKHAHTRRVDLTLEEIDGELTLAVVDYGRGFDTGASFPGHLGLRSMSERAHGLGGRVTIESEPGKGTCVRVVVPLRAAMPSADDRLD